MKEKLYKIDLDGDGEENYSKEQALRIKNHGERMITRANKILAAIKKIQEGVTP